MKDKFKRAMNRLSIAHLKNAKKVSAKRGRFSKEIRWKKPVNTSFEGINVNDIDRRIK